MKRGAGQRGVEGDHPVPYSPHHEARWEAYLMAKEMTKSLEVDIATLDKSVREMRAELCQVRNATRYLCTVASQIVQDSSRVCAILLLSLMMILLASPLVLANQSWNTLTRTPPRTMMKGTGGGVVRSFYFESIYDWRREEL